MKFIIEVPHYPTSYMTRYNFKMNYKMWYTFDRILNWVVNNYDANT